MILEKILLVLFLDVTITSELFIFTYLFYSTSGSALAMLARGCGFESHRWS